MNKSTIIVLLVFIIIILLFASLALTGRTRESNAKITVSDFFADYDDKDFDAAMQHTIVVKMNSSAQYNYVLYLETQALDESVRINSISDVTGSLSAEVSAAITSGMNTLSDRLGIGIDEWTSLLVNVTETDSTVSKQTTSDFYLLVLHASGGWYMEPASFQNDPIKWIDEYA